MKKKLLLSLIVITTIFTTNAQIQIGSDIDGENQGDRSGNSVSISSDGTIVAIGAKYNGNSNTGHVRVFENINNTWTQIGQDIDGENTGDEFGSSISLNDNGTVVAIGAPLVGTGETGQVQVFENINNVWIQIGEDIDGEAAIDIFGFSVDLNTSGTIIAIGAFGASSNTQSDTGHVRVFENINNTWTQIGQDIDGEAMEDFSGVVSINDTGNIVAIGAPNNDANGESSGQVRVFENVNNTWTQIGQSIIGEAAGDHSGTSISMSSDGSIIAIGATFNNSTNEIPPGHVRVYENINNTWIQVGQDIDGDADDELFGTSVSLNDNGTVLAVGATFSEGVNGEDSGQVKVYKTQNDNWIQIGDNIDGEAELNLFGASVSLSSSGDTLAIGATFNDGINGMDSGHVRVFDLSDILTIEDVLLNNDIILYPNPTSNVIILKNMSNHILKEITILDINGRHLEHHKTTNTVSDIQIDLKNYSSGIYFAHIQTKDSSIIKRIIKQ